MMVGLVGYANSHQLTPTYPEIVPSHIDNVSRVEMTMFNRREDVEFYAIEVFDSEWGEVPFAARNRLLNIKPFGSEVFDVYIRNNDLDRTEYICTISRIRSADASPTTVSSRICSKIK